MTDETGTQYTSVDAGVIARQRDAIYPRKQKTFEDARDAHVDVLNEIMKSIKVNIPLEYYLTATEVVAGLRNRLLID